jgi:DNA polymerase-3 subunit delta
VTPDAVRKQIADRSLRPVYLIQGDDAGEKAALISGIADSVEPELRAFNVERFYGSDPKTAVGAIVDVARTMPFGGSHRAVLVMQPEKLAELRRESETAEKVQALLEGYLEAPSATTILVFVPEARIDERTRLGKTLTRLAAVVECGGVPDPASAQKWIRDAVERAGKTIDPEAVKLLSLGAGLDMGRLRADVDRLLIFAGDAPRITSDDVRAIEGAAVSRDAWAMANALERRDVKTALRELALALDSGAVPYMVLGQLAWFVRAKMPPARAKGAIEAVFRTDLDIKSSVGDHRVLLERLVVELAGEGQGRGRDRFS